MTHEQLTEPLRQRDATIAQLQATIAELTETIGKLTGQLEWCRRQLFGRKSERFEDPAQPKLFADIPNQPESDDSAYSS
ncbi:MAG: transposase domain-containing protein [Phycisphaerales bacterium]